MNFLKKYWLLIFPVIGLSFIPICLQYLINEINYKQFVILCTPIVAIAAFSFVASFRKFKKRELKKFHLFVLIVSVAQFGIIAFLIAVDGLEIRLVD